MDYRLIDCIKSDLERLCDPSIINFFIQYFVPRGGTFRYTFWLRVMQYMKKKKILKYSIGIIVYLIFRHYEYKYGIHVNANISIGKGLKIVHGDGVYLNCKSIGENFTVYQNVTLGTGKSGEIPTVENNVTVYTGAVISGKVCLNDNCTVGVNSYVNHDVESNTTVAGAPAKIIGSE